MNCTEKYQLLSTVLTPFGYSYDNSQDIISTRNDAWQRQAGYTALFDKSALHFHMVFDSLPIYFNYQGSTWLIELWKGQYGISTGAEIGVYRADRILSEGELSTAHFEAVPDNERLFIKSALYRKNALLAETSGLTWWLAAFLPGMFSKPSQLSLDVAIRFTDCAMQRSFLAALRNLSAPVTFHCCRNEIHIQYEGSSAQTSLFRRLRIKQVQFFNAFFCRLYRFITRPFRCTSDRILYLYALLPSILRRMLRRLKGVIRR